MHRLCTGAAAASILILCQSGAVAQAAAPAAGSNSTVPEKTAPATSLDTKPGSLIDKLAPTNGVIAPTGDVDPAIHKEPPQSGNMPVMKPGQVPAQPGNSGNGGLY
ncbi:MAG: hypothetical protein ACRYGP_16175 [Janthinobacterium lividum]